MKIMNIDWDIDNDAILEKMNDMNVTEAAKLLGISLEKFANKIVNGTLDNFVLDKIHHLPALADEIMGLPNEIEVPDGLVSDEEITEWLEEKYGTFFSGYTLDSDTKDDVALDI